MSVAAALAIAERGFAVFPARDKRPLRGVRWKKEATTDPDSIREWWEAWPDAEVGVPMPPDTVAVDIDDLTAVQAAGIELPPSARQWTRSGGYHLLYTTDGRQVEQVVKREGIALDTRVGGKGYVIAYDPNAFDWTRWRPAPEWVYERGHRPSEASSSDPEAPMGTRDAILKVLGTIAAHSPIQITEGAFLALLHDWRAAGHIVDLDQQRPWTEVDFRQLADAASKWAYVAPSHGILLNVGQRTVNRSESDAPVETGEVALSEFMSEVMDSPVWLVDGLVPAGPAVGALLGQYKAGKSLYGLQLCFAVATPGIPQSLGRDIGRHGPALFIEYEGSRVRLQGRVGLMAAKFGAMTPPAPLAIIHRPKHKVDTPEGEAWLFKVCTGKALCVVGPVSKAASIQRENEPSEWQDLSERLQRVTDATGCTIVLIHHTRKPSQQFGPPKKVDDYFNMARGSNSYMGSVDFALGVQREPDAADGLLYFLERDGESGRLAYDFDAASLCIWPSDRPLTRPSSADRTEQAYVFIKDNPGTTRAAIAAYLDVTVETVKGYLTSLGRRVVESGEGNQTRTYKVAEEAMGG